MTLKTTLKKYSVSVEYYWPKKINFEVFACDEESASEVARCLADKQLTKECVIKEVSIGIFTNAYAREIKND